MPSEVDNPLIIWCLLDGKAGHQNQVLGCAEAIQRQTPAQIHPVELAGWNRGLWSLFRCDSQALPVAFPDLIVGAGHASHIPLRMLRQRFGGQSVVLMKPTIPLACFDFCLVPDVHRLRRVPDNVILTKGVLNRVRPERHKDAASGLLLIGGPSSHYRWSDDEIFEQVVSVTKGQSGKRWVVATSRRTPETFSRRIAKANLATLVRPDDVDSDWLLAQLAAAAEVWVSEDSVSMTYEALTSGSRVGILELQRHRRNRVTDCIDTLVDANLVARWEAWKQTGELPSRIEQFCESDRCATELLHRLRSLRNVKGASQRAA